ncbi:MAG: S8 family serine peptidase, partial [Bdellovibrionales bacterium]
MYKQKFLASLTDNLKRHQQELFRESGANSNKKQTTRDKTPHGDSMKHATIKGYKVIMNLRSPVKWYFAIAMGFLFMGMPFSYASRPKIKIAVIDTGIDIHHADLKEIVWKNPKEVKNGIDDDGNGFVDDLHGWNFVNRSGDVEDQDGHGTHIAGLIKQHISSNVSFELMPIKYFDQNMSFQQQKDAFLEALKYAIANDVNVIYVSGGGMSYSHEEYRLLAQASRKNILGVSAGCNKHLNQ